MIPDDEPWWLVRTNAAATGDGYGGSSNALPRTCHLADEANLDYLNDLDFKPFGYEW